MNYEVETGRWPCPGCGGPLRLIFTPSDYDDEGHAHGVECDEVLCMTGHELPGPLVEEIGEHADEELQRALEGGSQTAVVWKTPEWDGGG